MFTKKRFIWTLLTAIPMVCLLAMWHTTEGLPYNTDSNESFSAYVQGQNMIHFNPSANAFLTDDATAKHASAHPFTYSHGPNLPRYFSAGMQLLGLENLGIQILLSGVIATILTIYFIAKGFPELLPGIPGRHGITLGMLIVAIFATDFIGVLQFIGNLWRTWHFPLFWGCIWSVRTRPHWLIGFSLFFLVFQLEFLFALFTAATSLVYLLITYRNLPLTLLKKEHIALLMGSVTSVLFFIGQLVAFYGLDGFLFDLKTTYVARNTNTIEWETIRHFYEANAIMMWPSSPNWDFRFPIFLKATWEAMSLRLTPILAIMVLMGFVVSISIRTTLISTLSKWWSNKRLPFRVSHQLNNIFILGKEGGVLLWSMLAAYLLLGIGIPGYTLNGYTYRWAPLLVFPVNLAIALCLSQALLVTFTPHSRWTRFLRYLKGWVLAATILFIWVGVSINNFQKHPNFVHSPANLLATKFKGKSFVSATTFPHMIAHYTGRWAYYSPQVFPGNQRLDQTYNWNGDRNKNKDYETPEYYLCQKLPYYRQVDCESISNQMAGFGHQLIVKQPDYVIMKLNWALPSQQVN